MTGGTIITAALRLIKIIRFSGQTGATEELADGLAALNNLVDNWSTERLLVPVVGFNSFPLTAATPTYTIGTGGAINTPRPIRIDAAGIVQAAYNSGTVNFRTELKLLRESEYVAIKDKTATADIPEKLYYAPGVALGTIYLWPIPNVSSATNLELSAWTALASFPDQTTDVAIAPGYARALIYNLAVELQSEFPDSELTKEDAAIAVEAKRSIMKLNGLMVPEMPDLATPPATDAYFMPRPAKAEA